ncbi:2-phospho-L-lactate guanylyltransferase [Streptomyces lonarensis]|uniref:Phosphoenolpyruvate guanylyltransferase n=1 Tax=Streptomyces lonarensis TaxID=700599 RepID=A0A7X6I0B7_9ACTN|nr:2-phospho-L-lactate guanylyltransferase [Streptomyces lonarensis]NJQ07558.1 2-phospho-L-lactate guanylyltransferase [Streptomyces lonarensis]
MTGGWAVVMPVKRLGGAKTRLADAAGEELRPALALAFAEDTLAAVMECAAVSSVTVVTDDEQARATLSRLGAAVVPDSPRGGLNAAVEHGVIAVRAARPGAAVAVAALNADLPALRAEELARVLDEAAAAPRSFLADAAGTGTTLLAVLPGVDPAPGFGPASRMRHRASGAVELMPSGVESVRQDVDTGEDLLAAIALGVGPRTARSTHRLGAGFRRSAASHG